ncbi:MAG: glycosyltransferase family 2 protein [Anaeroplasma sp.]
MIDLVCPLYNCENNILELNNQISNQKGIELNVKYILTESNDKTEDLLIKNKINYLKIKKNDFSHSLTREKLIFESQNNYTIMISQDIKISDEYCFKKLYDYIINNNCAIVYLRQKGQGRTIDKYFRMVNYPDKSYVYDKDDLIQLELDACFCSDVCSIYDNNVFKRINGYDNKDLNTNEDMYYAYKLLNQNYRVGYTNASFVYHTHHYTYKQTYERYIQIGIFFKENKEIGILKNKNKGKYFKIILYMLKDFNLHSLFYLPINILARVRGIKYGKKYNNKK